MSASEVSADANLLGNLVSGLIGVVDNDREWCCVAIFTVCHTKVLIAVEPYPMPFSDAPLQITGQPKKLPLGMSVIIPGPGPGIGRRVAPTVFIASGTGAVVIDIGGKNDTVPVGVGIYGGVLISVGRG